MLQVTVPLATVNWHRQSRHICELLNVPDIAHPVVALRLSIEKQCAEFVFFDIDPHIFCARSDLFHEAPQAVQRKESEQLLFARANKKTAAAHKSGKRHLVALATSH